MPSENLFSYGTLQLESVQQATFGRLLTGTPDVLSGFSLRPLPIEDEYVIAVSGKDEHTIAYFTGRASDNIPGTVFLVSSEELQHADEYEVEPCHRISVVLQSGTNAWVYVDGRNMGEH
jgi:hypothetical protein